MVLVIVLLMGVVTFMDVSRERSNSKDQFQRRGQLLASSLNDVLANYLYFSHIDALGDIAEVVGSQPDISYVNIFTPDGRLLVTEPRREDHPGYATGCGADGFESSALRSGEAVLRFDGASLEVVSPIMSGNEALGVVQFGFHADALDAEIKEIILNHLWQALTLIAVGVLLVYSLARYASRYIGELATAASEMGRGHLDVRIPSK